MKKTYLILPVISTLVISAIFSTTVSGVRFPGDHYRPNAYARVDDHTRASIKLFNRMKPTERYKAYTFAHMGSSLQDVGFDVFFQQDQEYSIKMHASNAFLRWKDFHSHFNNLLASGADAQTDFVFDLRDTSEQEFVLALIKRYELPHTRTPDEKIQALGWQKRHMQIFEAAIQLAPWASAVTIKDIGVAIPIKDPTLFYGLNTENVPIDHFMKTIGTLKPDAWTTQHFR